MMLENSEENTFVGNFRDRSAISSLFDHFESIPLASLEKMSLLSRFDSKFVFHYDKLVPLIESFSQSYQVLEINKQKVFQYETTYLDTDDFKFYLMHHNGKPDRIKVRWRNYVDAQKIFFEVKCKTSKKKTEKFRFQETEILPELSSKQVELLNSLGYQDFILRPKVTISYDRITLVEKSENIKVTFDLNLKYENMFEEKVLPWLVIAEVKSNRASLNCGFFESARKLRIRKVSFSKYATGIACLESVKHNAFKPELLLIAKIKHERNVS